MPTHADSDYIYHNIRFPHRLRRPQRASEAEATKPPHFCAKTPAKWHTGRLAA